LVISPATATVRAPAQVFVSYASGDAPAARAVVAHLERRGHPCWFAERDVTKSGSFAEEIPDAIGDARVLLLLASPESNDSRHCSREIVLADTAAVSILPIRLVDFTPWGYLRYFLATSQWIDAAGSSIDARLDLIALGVDAVPQGGRRRERGAMTPALMPAGMRAGVDLGMAAPKAWVRLRVPRPTRRSEERKLTQPSLWLQAHNGFIRMLHREAELSTLDAFLEAPGVFRWAIRFGDGGVGKTRLGIELLRGATSRGWHAGLVNRTTLSSFVRSDGFTAWEPVVPTLIVVDYAASKVEDLQQLLQCFAILEADAVAGAPSSPPVRVLLLERHADADRGWLRDLLHFGESDIGDLIRHRCYDGAVQLQPPRGGSPSESFDATRDIIQATCESWAAATGSVAPGLPAFSDADWRRIQSNTGNRPLYLQMAAIYACEKGSADHLPAWGRGQLLEAAIQRERDYIDRECAADKDLRRAVEHVAACLCLAGIGSSRTVEWPPFLREQLGACGLTTLSVNRVEELRRALFSEPFADGRDTDVDLGLIQPDIVSEGFAATVLRGSRKEAPITVLGQLTRLAGLKAWSNLIRMVQDLHGLEHYEGIEGWLSPLLDACELTQLQALSQLIPERTISLHTLGLQVGSMLVHRTPSTAAEQRAEYLLAVGMRRNRRVGLDFHEVDLALEELNEAVRLLEPLVAHGGSEAVSLALARTHRELGWAHDNREARDGADALRDAARSHVLGALAAAGRYPSASLSTDAAYAMIPDVIAATPLDRPDAMLAYANCAIGLSIVLTQLNEPGLARDLAQRATQIGEDLAGRNWRLFAPDLARYLNNLGQCLNALDADLEQTLDVVTRSARIREEFARDNPDEYAHPLSLTLGTLLRLQIRADRLPAARATAERALSIQLELAARNPRAFRPDLYAGYHNVGEVARLSEQPDEFVLYREKALAVRAELCDGASAGDQAELATEYAESAATFLEVKRLTPAERALDRALETYSHCADHVESTKGVLLRNTLGRAQFARAVAEREQGRDLEAISSARGSAALFRQNVERLAGMAAGLHADALCSVAAATSLTGDWDENETELREAVDSSRRALELLSEELDRESPSLYAAAHHNLGHAAFRLGEIRRDADGIREGIQHLMLARERERQGAEESSTETDELLARAERALRQLTG
jgi:tetratricopeptide (TPR) repeat protein